MKFISTTCIALATLLQFVLADSEPFGVLSSHSSSHVHLLPVFDEGNGLLLGSSHSSTSSNTVSFTITDDSKVKFSNGKWAAIGSDGYLTDDNSEKDAINGWAIQNGVVTLNGNKEYYAVPTSDPLNWKISTKPVNGAIFFYLLGDTAENNSRYTFIPSGSTTEAFSSASQTTQATSSVVQVSSSLSMPTSPITISAQTENGSDKLGLDLSAGLVAAAAALLL